MNQLSGYEVFPYWVYRDNSRRDNYGRITTFSSASATVIDKGKDRIFDCTAIYDQVAHEFNQGFPVKYSGSCRFLQISGAFRSHGVVLHNGNYQIKETQANQILNRGKPVVGVFWFIDQTNGQIEFCD